MEVTDYEGEINLIIGIKYKLIVADTGIPILTTPHSHAFSYVKPGYQYKIEAYTHHGL